MLKSCEVIVLGAALHESFLVFSDQVFDLVCETGADGRVAGIRLRLERLVRSAYPVTLGPI